MTVKEYTSQLGFFMNPFQYTNADNEVEYLEKYFIEPSYFENIWGDTSNPCSNIVYAPRGAGKTAQRIMMERRASKDEHMLCITYTDHDLSSFKNVNDIPYEYHLIALNRLLLLGFFSELGKLDSLTCQCVYSFTERQYIYSIAQQYLYNTPASFPRQAISSLKTICDKINDLWKKCKEPLSAVINKFCKTQLGIDDIKLNKVDLSTTNIVSHKDTFYNIVQLLKKIEISTIYILIDRVDEQSLTGNDPKASYKFIEALLKDLDLLEMPGVGFKFFLWDALKPYCNQFARPDRIFTYDLHWTNSDLQLMLNKRLQTYSNGNIQDAKDLFEDIRSLGRTIIFAQGSPRDCIRICNRILTERTKNNTTNLSFSKIISDTAIDMFIDEKVSEIIPNQKSRQHLSKIHAVCYSIEGLVSKKLSAKNSAVRNIINPWNSSNLSQKIGTIPRKNRKSVNEYAFIDIRVARFACKNLDLDTFLSQKVKRCVTPTCNYLFYRDFDIKTYPCPQCGTDNP